MNAPLRKADRLGRLSATAGINTWIFTGSAGAEGSVSTGWHFGGRTREDASGKSIQETLYHFEGLTVRGRYYVQTGRTSRQGRSHSLETGSSASRGTSGVVEAATSTTRLIDRSFTATLIAQQGGPNDWTVAE